MRATLPGVALVPRDVEVVRVAAVLVLGLRYGAGVAAATAGPVRRVPVSE